MANGKNTRERWKEKVMEDADTKQAMATDKYIAGYDSAAYSRATKGRTDAFCEALEQEAMALCGDPYCALSNRKWGANALYFLLGFRG